MERNDIDQRSECVSNPDETELFDQVLSSILQKLRAIYEHHHERNDRSLSDRSQRQLSDHLGKILRAKTNRFWSNFFVSQDVLRKICAISGQVLRICILRNRELQALVEFDSIDTARRIKSELDGVKRKDEFLKRKTFVCL